MSANPYPKQELGELCQINIGKTPSRHNLAYWGNGHPWLSIADMSERGLKYTKEQITDLAVKECGCRIVPKNTLLMSFKLSIGKLGFTQKPMFTNEAIASLPVKDSKKLLPEYLYRALQVSDLLSGTDRAVMGVTLNKDKLYKIKIPLPPLEKQKRIAAILDKADDIRRKRAESLKLLDELLRATFLDMFGDPITNPKSWPTKGLLDLFDITTGKLDSNAAVPGGQYPFFTCARESFWIDNYAFNSEVLLLAGNNASADYSVKHYNGKFNAYQRTYVMSLKDQRNYYRLFKIALESRLGELKRRSKGTNTKYLTMGILKEIMLPVPGYNLQNQFDKTAQKIEAKCQKLTAYAAESDTLFHSLVARAFKGKL